MVKLKQCLHTDESYGALEKELKIELTAGGLHLGAQIKKNNQNNLFLKEIVLCCVRHTGKCLVWKTV